MTVEPNRRCRASVWDEGGWRTHQCGNRARALRAIGIPKQELPVCGIHLRSSGAYEYQPRDSYDAAIEAVVR